jgi:Ca-activated chloride channel family protein
MPEDNDFYARLRVSRSATPDQIRKAYFIAARSLHPDTNPDPDAAEQFIQLQQAYEVLSDEEKRADYDLKFASAELSQSGTVINIIYSRLDLARITDPQLVYVLLELLSPSDKSEDLTVPLNLCLVIDHSTSMNGPRLDMVKSNSLNLLRQMKSDSIISVVGFSDRAELILPASRLADIGKIESSIQLLKASGGTEIRYGLEYGLAEVRRSLNPRYVNHLILLTDGHTYGDETACLELAQNAAKDGIGISGLGIGDEWNDTFLDKLASAGGGSSLFVSTPNDLSNFLGEKLKNLVSVYAEGVTLEFSSDDEVELRCAFRVKPDQSPLETTKSTCLGNILTTSGLNIIFEFLLKPLPKRMMEVTLVRGRLKMNIPSRLSPRVEIPIKITRPVNDQSTVSVPHSGILQAISQLTLYRMQEKARKEAASGNTEKASSQLVNLATHLLSLGEQELAYTVLVEAGNLRTDKQFSKEGDKKIKYGTRALFQLPGGASESP